MSNEKKIEKAAKVKTFTNGSGQELVRVIKDGLCADVLATTLDAFLAKGFTVVEIDEKAGA